MSDYAHKDDKSVRSLARCRKFDFSISDGRPVLDGYFEYGEEGGLCQGLGYIVDEAFLYRFCAAIGVKNLREACRMPEMCV